MFSVRDIAIPEDGLLRAYSERPGCYTDCFYIDTERTVSIADFVFAFFTTPIFKLERRILAATHAAPSTDEGIEDMAAGRNEAMALWRVEKRAPDQLLMRVTNERVRTWLMIAPQAQSTRLYFGSAVVPKETTAGDEPEIGLVFRSLLRAHRFYSMALLWSAKRKIERSALPIT